MPFGVETEEELANVMNIANAIQGAVPAGSNGGQVMFAMSLLIAAGAFANFPAHKRDGVAEEFAYIFDAVMDGRIIAKFVKDH